MPDQTNRALFTQAIDLYGPQAQLDQLTEEAAEVIAAVNHDRRRRPDARDELIHEAAQLQVMLEQLRLIVGPQSFDLAYRDEVLRLATRLANDRAKQAALEGKAGR